MGEVMVMRINKAHRMLARTVKLLGNIIDADLHRKLILSAFV